jgi:hypothetical protein
MREQTPMPVDSWRNIAISLIMLVRGCSMSAIACLQQLSDKSFDLGSTSDRSTRCDFGAHPF